MSPAELDKIKNRNMRCGLDIIPEDFQALVSEVERLNAFLSLPEYLHLEGTRLLREEVERLRKENDELLKSGQDHIAWLKKG